MKLPFSRWLPAIAENPRARQGVLVVAGLTALGTAAVVPGADLPRPSVNPAAASALRQATSADEPVRVLPPTGPADTGTDRAATAPSSAGAAPPQTDTGGKRTTTRKKEPARPDLDTLMPYGTQGYQSWTPLSREQWRNAERIVSATKRSGLGERAAVIAVATSLQEAKLQNLGHLGAYNDHDSQGLFQQRPSSGWGSPEQVTDPEYSTRAFLDGLRRVYRWWDLPLTDAAQSVQISAYPFAYAQWERQAADIVQRTWNDS